MFAPIAKQPYSRVPTGVRENYSHGFVLGDFSFKGPLGPPVRVLRDGTPETFACEKGTAEL